MKEYLVTYNADSKEALTEALAPFDTHYFRYTPRCSVRVPADREQSFLETLAAIPDITYRQSQQRRALRDDKNT
jgi:hypothetical protein